MSAQIVPLTSEPNQTFTAQLSIDGQAVKLQLGVRFNQMAAYWVLSVADAAGNPLLDSVPMLTGSYPAANILAPYAYLKIGSAYIINASGTTQDAPAGTNLGTDFVLVWDDTPAA